MYTLSITRKCLIMKCCILFVCSAILYSLFGSLASSQDFKRRERAFDVLHYSIDVRFDQPKRMVIGSVSITMTPLRPSFQMVELDAVNMSIESARLPKGGPLAYDYDSSKLRVTLDRMYRFGEKIVLTIRYRCTPQRGLYFILPDASYPDDPEQIWTQGQGEDNRHWLPCYDYPNDKATSEIRMTVKSDYTTLSNGFLKSKRKNKDGTTTWHWVQDTPHSAYLIMLAAGRYDIHQRFYDGIPVQSYHYPSDDPKDVERCFASTVAMVRFFSEKIGIRYPWAKYAQIPVAHFLYGGMENTTATVLADHRTVVDARAALDYSPEGLIAHELAHQWWGDYLTYIDWENGWLNEGFATYFQQLWTEHAFGQDEFRYQRYEGIQSYMRWADESGRIPIVTDRANSSYNIYGKGAAVLHMLRRMVGDEQFWRIMRHYGEKHACGSVETNDFKRAIEEISGLSMRWFFDQWVYKAGYPEVRVTKSWDTSSKHLELHFAQTQSTDSLCGYFRLPMLVRLHLADSIVDRSFWFSTSDTTVRWHCSVMPDMVTIDPDGTICGRVTLESTPDELMMQFRHNPNAMKRIEAGLGLVRHLADQRIRKEFFTAIPVEPYGNTRFKIATALSQLKPDSLSYTQELQQLFLKLVVDPQANVRSTALGGLNLYRDTLLRQVFITALADSSYFVEAAAMNCLLTIDSTSTEGIVMRKLQTPSYRNVVEHAALDWVVRYQFRNALPIVRNLASPGPSRELRMHAVTALFEMGYDPDTLRSIILSMLTEPSGDFRMFAITSLPRVFPADAANRLTALLSNEKDGRVRRHIESILHSAKKNREK